MEPTGLYTSIYPFFLEFVSRSFIRHFVQKAHMIETPNQQCRLQIISTVPTVYLFFRSDARHLKKLWFQKNCYEVCSIQLLGSIEAKSADSFFRLFQISILLLLGNISIRKLLSLLLHYDTTAFIISNTIRQYQRQQLPQWYIKLYYILIYQNS